MKVIPFSRLGLLFFTILVALAFSAAQDVSKSPDNAAASQGNQDASTGQAPASAPTAAAQAAAPHADQTKTGSKEKPASGTSQDRLFFALPNFLTVQNAGSVPPLTAGQKFKVVARGAFDPVQIVWYAALSGIGQAENSEPGYGQGAEGYAKRYGAYAADGTIENFMVGAIFPSMLHQDPRFFRSGQGSFFHRAGYAASRIVVTRGDSGRREFNFSEVFGAALASAISTYSYHPHPGYHPAPGVKVPYVASDRTLSNTVSVWGSQVGYDAITLMIKEFWPDIARKMKKQSH